MRRSLRLRRKYGERSNDNETMHQLPQQTVDEDISPTIIRQRTVVRHQTTSNFEEEDDDEEEEEEDDCFPFGLSFDCLPNPPSTFHLVIMLVLLCLLVRTSLVFHSHSGQGVPPMFGDYEVSATRCDTTQRHTAPHNTTSLK